MGDWEVEPTYKGDQTPDYKDRRGDENFKAVPQQKRVGDEEYNPVKKLWDERGKPVNVPDGGVPQQCNEPPEPMLVQTPEGNYVKVEPDVRDETRCTAKPSTSEMGDYNTPSSDEGNA